jgi:threonine 3-dehydrogenase
MQAVVKARAEPGLWLEEVPVPEVRGDDVRIRVLKTSICGTDIHIYNWDAWAQKTIPVPMTIGHEFVGVADLVVVTESLVTFASFCYSEIASARRRRPAMLRSRGATA